MKLPSLGQMFRSPGPSTHLAVCSLLFASATAPLAQSLAPSSDCPGWIPTFGAFLGPDESVRALVVHDDGTGAALYVGGSFITAGGLTVNGIAKWDGSSWGTLGSGVNSVVHALATYDDGSGPALYAGGVFTIAGGVSANKIAKWDGVQWSALVCCLGGQVDALAVYDDGGGPALYVGGTFTSVAGVPANRIAKWDGSSWSALGSGLNNNVFALAVYDDGSGPALYAGGIFWMAGGVLRVGIARWNGSSWTDVGNGINWGSGMAYVRALTVLDDGSGPALYAGGRFSHAGNTSANNLARWDGSSWSALGDGTNESVTALTSYSDAHAAVLFAGGSFTNAGGLPANRIAAWDGSNWTALGCGMNGQVLALSVFDDGSGRALFAGGDFTSACDSNDAYLAKWGCPQVVLDFSREDDFATPLGNGQRIDTEFGRLVRISGAGANAGPTTFDTTPGGPNDPAINDDMLIGHGNVLLLEDDWYSFAQTVPGFFDVVTDDPQGGNLIFDFLQPVDPRSMLLADINPTPNLGASVTLTDGNERTRVYAVEPGWTGGYGNAGPWLLDLTTTAPQPGNGTPRFATATEDPGFQQGNVVQMVVHMTGFGAVDDLSLHLPQASATTASATTRNGSGRNPTILRSGSRPALGSTWRAELDCSAHGSGHATLVMRRRASFGTMTPFGEVLVGGDLLFRETHLASTTASAFTWNVPNDMALVGLDLHVQGACQGGPAAPIGKVRRVRGGLSNALDLILGF